MNSPRPLTDDELIAAKRRGLSPAAYANQRLKLGRYHDALPPLTRRVATTTGHTNSGGGLAARIAEAMR